MHRHRTACRTQNMRVITLKHFLEMRGKKSPPAEDIASESGNSSTLTKMD